MLLKQIQKSAGLRQRSATWLVSRRRAYAWINPQGERAYRPYAVLVADIESEKVRRIDIAREFPQSEDVLQTILRAMRRPILGTGGRQRPKRIILDDAHLVEALSPLLTQIDIRCTYKPTLPLINELLYDLAVHMYKQELIPGLLSVPGVTVPLVEDLYTAAAEFYRRAPWDWLGNQSPLELRSIPEWRARREGHPVTSGRAMPEERLRYALVLGSGGETFGLSVYESLDDIYQVYGARSPERVAQQISWFSLIFEEAPAMSFYDLDMIEYYNWPVAGELAYPVAIKTGTGSDFAIPSTAELAFLAAALRVIPDFIFNHIRAAQGVPLLARAVYALPDVHSQQAMAVHYWGDLRALRKEKHWGTRAAEYADINEPLAGDLESYIHEWYWDEESHAFARQLGQFLLDFMDGVARSGLSERTVKRHGRNSWLIGRFVCRYGYYETFSPDIFLSSPAYIGDFKRKVSPSPTALKAYMTTWRKITRYVRNLKDEG